MSIKTKYNFDIPLFSFESNVARLTNQLWKLIPMRENDEDWKKQIDTVLIEIVGLNEICSSMPQFLQLLSKLEGIRIKGSELSFESYRKTVFESISLLQRLKYEKS